MPHQCIHCGKVYPDASKELLEGCSCGSRFFFYILKERLDQIKEDKIELVGMDKEQVEKDVREIIGDIDEERPVILDLESVKILKPGTFEIDIVNLFNKERPLIYKLEEGKYIIDLASSLQADLKKHEEQ
jgi:predicted  nucleic acid-binding Zn-ribbon protein